MRGASGYDPRCLLTAGSSVTLTVLLAARDYDSQCRQFLIEWRPRSRGT
jgi:hypothetical protein